MTTLDDRPSFLNLAWLVGLCLLFAQQAVAAPDRHSLEVDEWLVLSPVARPLPSTGDFAVADLLEEPGLDVQSWPHAGQQISFPAGSRTWSRGDDLALDAAVSDADNEGPRQAWLAVFINVEQFTAAELTLTSDHLLRAWVGGEAVVTKAEAQPAEQTASLTLPRGKHLLLVEAISEPGSAAPWRVQASLSTKTEGLSFTLSPRHGLRLQEVLGTSEVEGIRLSPNGEMLAVSMRDPASEDEFVRRWTEIVDSQDGSPRLTLPAVDANFRWLPDGRFVYSAAGRAETTDLWLGSITGASRPAVRGIEAFEEFHLVPGGETVVYVTAETPEADPRGVKRYLGTADRWSYFRQRNHLYQASLISGIKRRLTLGGYDDTFQDLSPDGRKMLISRTYHGGSERPFSRTELLEVNLATLASDVLREFGWFDRALYSPDGQRLLILGSPAIFDQAGADVEEGVIANDYDTQAFLFEPQSGNVRPITRDYDPTILDAQWSRHDGLIYFRTQERSWVKLVAFDPAVDSASASFTPLPCSVDVVTSFDLAAQAASLACVGTSADLPQMVQVRATAADAKLVTVARPSEQQFAQVDFGRVETWSFEHEDGSEIMGRIHYPADFDPARKYPLIVNYYGGTVPTSRSFGGRYPKNYWAANGYIVYVPQPSGATGFGQEFSARHVNAWGRRTADEILAGVEKLVAEHSFIDGDRIGCIGASYGGFMTMYLQTRSKIFAAAISHAGISAISSYWGEGWWGYLYSAAASAGSYPWNARDLYVEQSPLHHADKIETPLLLLHGDADTNVPPGESQQMYTALKVLGKEVELIEIGEQDHWIVDRAKRRLWSETIVAWFDKHLKGQDAYWRHLWEQPQEVSR